MVLVLRGGEVYGLDVVEAPSARPSWLTGIGGHYIDGRQIPAEQVQKQIGPMDLILDAQRNSGTGIQPSGDALAVKRAYVVTGIPGGDRPLQIPGAELIRQLVLNNQVMLGSVNPHAAIFKWAPVIWSKLIRDGASNSIN